MNLKEKPVQTCDIDRHKVHETLIKLIPISVDCVYILIPTCIKNVKKYTYKNFPSGNICTKNKQKTLNNPERERCCTAIIV